MEDDDWGLSFEELDSLERNAAAQIANRNNSASSSRFLAAPILIEDDTDVPWKARAEGNSSMSLSLPQKNGVINRIHTSPVKKTGRELNVRLFRDEPGRIAVECPYHPDLVALLRTVTGKRWHQARKVWTYPEGELDNVLRAIKSFERHGIVIDAEQALPVHYAEQLEGHRAEKDAFHEDRSESWVASPQKPVSSQGSYERGVRSREPLDQPTNTIRTFPKSLYQQPSEDGPQKAPQNVKSSQDADAPRPPPKSCTVSLFLHSSGKIAAKFEYDSELVAALRKIAKSEWNAKERLWMFPFSSLGESEKILSNVNNRLVRVESLAPLVKRALEATAAVPNLQDRYDFIPEQLRKTLMDFQVEGVKFSLQHGGRALIADEMGLGKTLQALAVVSCLREDWPVLVIVPSSLRLNWATMLEKWLHIDPSRITIVMSSGGSYGGFKIVHTTGKHKLRLDGLFNIVSYDVLTKLEDIIYLSDFQIVIADESHYMKNPTAKRTNACVPMLQKAKHALLLTGTPALSRPIEMFKQLEALQPSVYRRMDEFGKRYCMGGYFGVWQGASNHDELHALVKSTVMIRRLKKDVMKQLPKKRREQVFISLDEKGARRLHELLRQLDVAKKEHRGALGKKNPEEAHKLNFAERQLLAQIYTESAESKLPAVQDYLTTVIESNCKFLVFAHHQCMMDGIQDLLQNKKVQYIRIDGKTPASSRQDMVKKFQEQPDVLVALLGIHAAGVGLTLTAASTVIFAEMSWTPGVLVQAEDRVHRIGQESAVNVYYLHAHGSVDDLIWDSVQLKLENLGQVLDGEDSSMHVAPTSVQQGGTSLGQETLDPYLVPLQKFSAPSAYPTVPTHAAEILTPSQAKASIEAFLHPFEIGKYISSGQRTPACRDEDLAVPRTSESSEVRAGSGNCLPEGTGAVHPGGILYPTGQDFTNLEDDLTCIDDLSPNLSTDRFMQYVPHKKKTRLM